MINSRPDLRAKRLVLAQRKTEIKLARALQYPDPMVGLGVMLQGPQGPDNQQQWNVGVGVPLIEIREVFFNRKLIFRSRKPTIGKPK